MRSDVVDSPPSASNAVGVHELLVLWQHPNTREIVPIGRLANTDGRYRFDYTRAALEVSDFRPLPGYGSLTEKYVSSSLPAIFRQRVMATDRPDFANYMATLGLHPQTATPWEQIVQSGGDRAGDTLQFMAIPQVVNGRAQARFLTNGIRYILNGETRIVAGRSVVVTPAEHERALHSLVPGDRLDLLPEEQNSEDPCATVVCGDGIPLGYAPRFLSRSIRNLAETGPVEAEVVRVNGPDSPAHLRLVLQLDTSSPIGFEFDRDGLWEPIST